MATKVRQNNNVNKRVNGGEKAEVIRPITIVCNPNDVIEYYRTHTRSMRVPSKLIFHNPSGWIGDLKKEWTRLQWGKNYHEYIPRPDDPIPPIHKIRFKVGRYILDNEEYISDYFGPNGVFGPDEKITVEVKHWNENDEQDDVADAEDIERHLEKKYKANMTAAVINARKKRNNKFKAHGKEQYSKLIEPMEDKVEKQFNKIISDIKNIQNDENVIDNLSKKLTELDNFIKKNRNTLISHPIPRFYFKEIQQLIFKRHKDLPMPDWAWKEYVAPQFHSLMGRLKLFPSEAATARKKQKDTEMRAHGAFPPLRKSRGGRKKRRKKRRKTSKKKRRKTRKKRKKKTRRY